MQPTAIKKFMELYHKLEIDTKQNNNHGSAPIM